MRCPRRNGHVPPATSRAGTIPGRLLSSTNLPIEGRVTAAGQPAERQADKCVTSAFRRRARVRLHTQFSAAMTSARHGARVIITTTPASARPPRHFRLTHLRTRRLRALVDSESNFALTAIILHACRL